MTTFAPYQRPPKPPRRVRCLVCGRLVLPRNAYPVAGEWYCAGHSFAGDGRLSHEPREELR